VACGPRSVHTAAAGHYTALQSHCFFGKHKEDTNSKYEANNGTNTYLFLDPFMMLYKGQLYCYMVK